MPTPDGPRTEQDALPPNEKPSLDINHNNHDGGGQSPVNKISAGPTESATDASTSGNTREEDETRQLARILADTLENSLVELRRYEEARISQFQQELSASRQGEEDRLARLMETIATLNPQKLKTDPATNFWTVYKKVADEYDDDLLNKHVGDLDASLLFAGLFSAVATTFIVQIIPSAQPNPFDITNALLLRILQHNDSFGGSDPLAPIMNVAPGVVQAQSILFASLAVTLFVAFVAVLGKQWILYYTRGSTWGNIVDRGKERQRKLAGLQKWGLHLILESLPVLLQLALLLFGIGLGVYLWDLDISAAVVVLVVTCFGATFYGFITISATIWRDCPFQTPLSILIPKAPLLARKITTLARSWMRRRTKALLSRFQKWLTDHLRRRGFARQPHQRARRLQTQDQTGGDVYMALSNPVFWRDDPLFTSTEQKDVAASAGFWLLENSTDFSAASAVAAVFSKFQWPSHQLSPTALIRFRDTYVECFRAPKLNRSTRLRALQSAAAYYVLYHTQLIWSIWKGLDVEVSSLLSDHPPDLLLHKHSEEWNGDDVFEYLLHIEDRSEPVTSARFLSYIAPYWFCGDSDSAVRFRPSRLQTLYELVAVLESSQALDPATLTDCVLCVGAAMDFPLHPEDLIRVDKSDYLQPTFKLVVERIHGVALSTEGRCRHFTRTALDLLLHLSKKTPFPLVDVAWINKLLEMAAVGKMNDVVFVMFLRLCALRMEIDDAEDEEPQGHFDVQDGEMDRHPPGGAVASAEPTPEYTLLTTISRNVKICSDRKEGWQDGAVYGGLIAIRDIRQLRSLIPDVGFIKTLAEAMEKDKPFGVRRAAYDVVQVAQVGWLKSWELCRAFKDLDLPRKLHGVMLETRRSDHQVSFLKMMEILSRDRFSHSYLRGAMDIWLDFRHEGSHLVTQILRRVGEISPLEYDSNLPLDSLLVKMVEDEWARVPARRAMDLSVDLLLPLAEVTTQLKEMLFTENHRRAVLTVIERVIPSLEKRRDDGYEGPGTDICDIIDCLRVDLGKPTMSTSGGSSHWHTK